MVAPIEPPPQKEPPSLAQAWVACAPHLQGVIVFSAAINVLFLAPILYALQVYDRVLPTRGLETLAWLSAMLVFALLTMRMLDVIRTRLALRASERLARMLGPRIMEAALETDAPEPKGMAMLQEFATSRRLLTGPLFIALIDAPWTVIYVLVAFVLHPALGLFLLGGMLAIGLLTVLQERTARRFERLATEVSEPLDDRALLSAGRDLKVFGIQRHLLARWASADERRRGLALAASLRTADYVTWTRFLRLGSQAAVTGLAAFLAVTEGLSVGSIFAASLLVGRAYGPFDQLLGHWRELGQARRTLSSVGRLLAIAPSVPPATTLPDPRGALQLENATLLTPARERILMGPVSLSAGPGEVVAVTGRSGAGKSLLLRMIAGAVSPSAGAVRLDGAPLGGWSDQQLAQLIGYLPQAPRLFPGTIRDNIAGFRPPSAETDRQVVLAAQAVLAHETILRQPRGYETLLSGSAEELSPGQVQQIALARAVFGGPRLVVLDEPEAHLDPEARAALGRLIETLRAAPSTVVLVTGDAELLAQADRRIDLPAARPAHPANPPPARLQVEG